MPETATPWDGLPVTGPLLRQKAASAYLGISRSAFYREIAAGRRPKPVPILGSGWQAAKGYPVPWLDAVIAARATGRHS